MVKEEAIKDECTALLLQGKTISVIHNEHFPEISLMTLYRWKKLLFSQGHIRPKKASGRPTKTTERDERHLVRLVKNDPSLSIKKAINESNIDICHQTAVKILAETLLCPSRL